MHTHSTKPDPLEATPETHKYFPGSIPGDTCMVSLFFFGLTLLGFISIMVMNRGVFTYTLDDPYIHLAVAEELATSGHYGVNPGEVSAPCSSPLWPFLMVPFARLPGFTLVPLMVNVAAAFMTALLALGRVRMLVPCKHGDRSGAILRAAVVAGFLLATNAVGLVFTGMEHSLQILLAVLVVEGMLRLAERFPPGKVFYLAVVIGPWVRYENMALTLAAVILCFALGRRRQTFLLGAAALTGLVVFSGYLVSLGLSPIPASITAKSTFVGEEPVMAALKNFKHSIGLGRGMIVALGVSLLAGIALAWRGDRAWCLAMSCLALAGFLHLIAGAYGWVNRYEIYILAALIWGLAAITGKILESLRINPGRRLGWALLPLVPVIGFPYLVGLMMLPLAANNIYEQHYQMHRFAADYWRRPVAVNDLGYVSFRNDPYVLDLWGLASPLALKARMNNEDPAWMNVLAEKHGVELAMIYSAWFPVLPTGWKKVGALRLSRKLITPAGSEVSIYATNPKALPEITEALDRFRKSLPREGMLEIFAP
ncbi:MAG: hypothetical protein Q8Q59_03585 [Luteolibacter sp.]|nr:hypothetical protein [Luteolibacter sp.]